MINGRRYHSGLLIQPAEHGRELSEQELEVLIELASLQFTFESGE